MADTGGSLTNIVTALNQAVQAIYNLSTVLGGVGVGGGGAIGPASGDLNGTFPSPLVAATHLTAPLPLAQGGTAGATAVAARANFDLNRDPISVFFTGSPPAGTFINIIVPWGDTLPAGLAGSFALAGTTSTGTVSFVVNQIPVATNTTVQIGTITFSVSFRATFAANALTTISPGDIIQIVAPSPADASLANIAITLVATRT